MQLVDFRYSDTDFVSYLMTLGYIHHSIEITVDRFSKYRAFVHFYENREDLLRHFNNYKNKNVNIDIQNFSNMRKKITKLIKSEISNFQMVTNSK